MIYLNHNFIYNGNDDKIAGYTYSYYECNECKCLLLIESNEIKESRYIIYINESRSENLTCEEVLIKKLLE